MNGVEMKMVEDLKGRLFVVDHFRRDPGFELFKQAMQQALDFSERAMVTTDNPHECAKQVGARHAIKSMMTWADREVDALRLQINEIERRNDR